MDLRIFVEPQQGATFADLLAVALATRAAGFSAFFRSDHLLRMGDGDPRPGPSDSWVMLAAIGAVVPDIRLGTPSPCRPAGPARPGCRSSSAAAVRSGPRS